MPPSPGRSRSRSPPRPKTSTRRSRESPPPSIRSTRPSRESPQTFASPFRQHIRPSWQSGDYSSAAQRYTPWPRPGTTGEKEPQSRPSDGESHVRESTFPSREGEVQVSTDRSAKLPGQRLVDGWVWAQPEFPHPARPRMLVTSGSPRYSDVVKANPKYNPPRSLPTVPPSPYAQPVGAKSLKDSDGDISIHEAEPRVRDHQSDATPGTPRRPESRPSAYPTPPSTGPRAPRRREQHLYSLTNDLGYDTSNTEAPKKDEGPPQSSSELDAHPLQQDSAAVPTPPPSAQGGGGILYRLICIDGDEGTFRYSWKPFKGLQRDDREIQERRDLAVLDIVDMVEGDHLTNPPRKNQSRHSFSQDDPADFNLGVDFHVRKILPTGLRIHSQYIQAVLRALIPYYPGFNAQEIEISFIYPFKELFHYWNDLQHILQRGRDGATEVVMRNPDTGYEVSILCGSPTYEHLDTLLEAHPVKDTWEKLVEPELELYQTGRASYDFLWLLFKPGDIVFAETRGLGKKLAGFIVMRVTHVARNKTDSPQLEPHPADCWELGLWNLAYDGGRLRRRAHTVYVNRFYGERNIADLPAFPTRFAPDQEAWRARLIERGKRYHRILCDGQSHMRYNGSVIAEKAYHYQGEIIVDHQSYKLEALDSPSMEMPDILGEEPEDLRGEPMFSKFNDMECSADNELEPAQYLLLPAYVLGFALGKREWAIFDMDFVEDLVADKRDPLTYLIMDLDKKKLIEAAAGTPRTGTVLNPWTTDWSADFIEGKGRGRVIFLHGPPGTGKTMTVELVAKKTRRPLIRLSAADLGTEEVQMENRLMKWLDRATLWGSIVLIDEAEVYLEQRQSGDISRNALVTAFLRTMEYFPGLLFLTSNGIGLFDEAVMSRIHLAVQYQRPTDKERTDIWRKLFDKLEQDQRRDAEARQRARETAKTPPGLGKGADDHVKPTIIIPSTTRDVVIGRSQYAANFQLNGRDIRNLLLSAISLAQFESLQQATAGESLTEIEVTAEQLETVLKNKEQFNDDYKRATGLYPDQLAAERSFRRDRSPSVK